MNKNLYAVILAGGSGTRFWPVSRAAKPKQFLNIVGSGSLLAQTIKRLRPLTTSKNIFIVASVKHRLLINKESLAQGIPSSNLLFEPSGKNTAPAVCWAAKKIHERNPAAVLIVLPSDHHIAKLKNFLAVVGRAVKEAENGSLVTLGILPNRPETGYGYIKFRKADRPVYKVLQFVEKPSLAKAKQYVKSGQYLWNSGMFIWKTKTILDAFQKILPEIYYFFKNNSDRGILQDWKKLPSISVDCGILEKAKSTAVIPAFNIGWSDLGSWESLDRHLKKDKHKNSTRGDVLQLDSFNNLIWSRRKLIAVVGVEDLVIVETEDALLVCRKDCSQKVKDLVQILKSKGHSL